MTVIARRDGGLDKMELNGHLTLRISDDAFGRIKLQIRAPTNNMVQTQTHPNVDKELMRRRSQIALKNPAKPFPLNTDVGVLKWRLQTTDESNIPLSSKFLLTLTRLIFLIMCLALFSVNCWPSDNGQGGCDVNIEYELEQDQLELQDVVITIPIPWVCLSVWYIFSYIEVSIYFSFCSHGSGSPVVAECDGEYTFEKRCNELLWQLPLIDANNKTGSMEFSSSGTPDDFFPVQVAFFSKKSFSGLQVRFQNLIVSYELWIHLKLPGKVWSPAASMWPRWKVIILQVHSLRKLKFRILKVW